MKSVVQQIFFALFLIVGQVALFPNLAEPLNRFNFVLISLLFLGFIYSFRTSLILALIVGVFLELYSGFWFGMITVSLFFALLVCQKIFTSVLTNRSFYTILILVFFATLVYHFVEFAFLNLNVFFSEVDLSYQMIWQQSLIRFVYALVINSAFAVVLYWTFSAFTKGFSALLPE